MLYRKILALGIVIIVALAAGSLEPHPVYVHSYDNYSHMVTLVVDGKESVTHYVAEKEEKLFVFYFLEEGSHNFTLVADDNCGNKKSHSTLKEVGGREKVTLGLEMGREVCPARRKTTIESTPRYQLSVEVENGDDDSQYIRLDARNKNFHGPTRSFNLAPLEGRTVKFDLEEGRYNVSLRWSDPDTPKVQKEVKEVNLQSDVTLPFTTSRVEVIPPELRRPQGQVSVIVSNEDDDDLWVDVFVDRETETRFIASGQSTYYGEFKRLSEGEHEIKVRWLDPDTYRHTFRNEFSTKSFTVVLEKNESRQLKASVERLE